MWLQMFYYVGLGTILLALIFVLACFLGLMKNEEGNEDMMDIAKIIRHGAFTFMKTEYRAIIITVVAVAILLTLFIEKTAGITFIAGAFASSCVCIFGMVTGTYANVDVISINNWSNVTLTVNATNNTLNANKATPYTYDPAKGETEADSVKIGNVTSVRNYYLFDTLSGGYSTINESDTVLSGDIAIASKYTPKK